MAVVVETKELLETVVASLVAGVGITVVFSVAIWGVGPLRRPQPQRTPPGRGRGREPRPAWRVLVTLAAVVFGIVVMTASRRK